jgi:hypothetical protein
LGDYAPGKLKAFSFALLKKPRRSVLLAIPVLSSLWVARMMMESADIAAGLVCGHHNQALL